MGLSEQQVEHHIVSRMTLAVEEECSQLVYKMDSIQHFWERMYGLVSGSSKKVTDLLY